MPRWGPLLFLLLRANNNANINEQSKIIRRQSHDGGTVQRRARFVLPDYNESAATHSLDVEVGPAGEQ
jgi:hypothetical protein